MSTSEPSAVTEHDQLNGGDGHIPPDPHADSNGKSEAVTEASASTEATPKSRRDKKALEETPSTERPDWLPENWYMYQSVRTSGATAGTIDKYYKEPVSGKRFRSKNEVLRYIETGITPKKRPDKPDANGDNTQSGTTGAPKKKKSSAKAKKEPAGFTFDFDSPPELVTWALEDAEQDRWSASIEETKVSESIQNQWTAVFDHLSNHKP